MRARLEGAMAQRRLRGWQPPLENINSLVASGGPRLLARARELVVTNGYAANACEAFASNLVGDGIKPSSLIEDADLRDRVQRLWLAWTDEADADGLTDFYGLQAMVAREMFVAGECFVRLRPRRAEDGLLVPLQLQLLQSEMLPFEKTETAGERQPHPLRHRVRRDRAAGRLSLPPPPSRRQHRPAASAIPETVRVPAEDVLHIYRPIDAGQIRGLPHVAPAMVRLFLLDQYDDAELDRKKTAAMFAGFITKTAPEEPLLGEIEADRRRRRDCQPGARHDAGAAAGRGREVLQPRRCRWRLRGVPVPDAARRSRPRWGCPIIWSPAMCARPTIPACAPNWSSSAAGSSSCSTG